MTVPADYEPIIVQSADTSVNIPIDWDYESDLLNIRVLQQDLVTGDTRTSVEGGFTIVKNFDDSITVEQYSPFAGNNTEYTVTRQTSPTQDYDLTEQSGFRCFCFRGRFR